MTYRHFNNESTRSSVLQAVADTENEAATIQNADNILVLDQGDIIEQGTHQSLMDQKGTYYDMYMSQWQ